MATWDNVVYTTQGLNLMAKLQTGAALEITRAIGSDGHISADALPSLTEITAKQTLTLSDAIYKGNGQALLPVTLYNRGLTEGYPLRQIGIYATDPDDGEVLMLVAQSETPDTIPSELASPDFVANFSFHVALGNAGRINVTYSLTDMATRADLDNINAQLANKANIADLGKPGGIATLNSSGKLVQMPTAADVGAYVSCPIYISQSLSQNAYIVFVCEGLSTGAYLFSAQGCYNPNGYRDYRSVYVSIINIACGYQNNTVIEYVKQAPLLVSYGFGRSDTDSTFTVGFEHMDVETPHVKWNGKIYIQAQKSVGEPVDWSCSLKKLI